MKPLHASFQIFLHALVLTTLAAGLQSQTLIADLAPGSGPGQTNSTPQPLGIIDGRLLYVGHGGPDTGRELYSTDGTPAGTHLVRHIGPAGADGIPWMSVPLDDVQPSWEVNGLVFFPADDGLHGLELWCSDGTTAGTRMVQDIHPGSGSASPVLLAVLGSLILFTADDGMSGRELYASDGTAAGTIQLIDLVPGPGTSDIGGIVVVGSNAYFAATEANRDRELWRTDGTTVGTYKVIDLWPGPAGSIPIPLCAHGNELLFAANTAAYGTELWRTDGTAAGTHLVQDITPGTESTLFVRAISSGGRAYIAAYFGLYVLDTQGLSQIPIAGNRLDRPFFAPCGNGILAVSKGIFESTVWYLEGTTARRLLLEPFVNLGNFGAPLIAHAGGTLFTWRTPAQGIQSWWTDGTVAGTRIVTDDLFSNTSPLVTSGPAVLFPFGSDIVFARTHEVYGRELFRTNGIRGGTSLVADLDSGQPLSSRPADFARFGKRLLFRTTDPSVLGYGSRRVHVTDGTSAGTVALSEYGLLSGPASEWVLVAGERAMFGGTTGNMLEIRPFITDGTRPGTIVLDMMSPTLLGTLGDRFVLGAIVPGIGRELVITDGTEAGTLVIDLKPGALYSAPANGVSWNGRVYFSADDGVHGRELWVTDGTAAGTRMVADIEPGPVGSNPSAIAAADSRIYFAAMTSAHGFELWRSDGTGAGTQLVADLLPGPVHGLALDAHTYTARFMDVTAVIGDTLFFPARQDASTGRYVWLATDGTLAGTRLLPLGPGLTSYESLGSMTRADDLVYWVTQSWIASGGVSYLGVSDGTAAGTTMLLSVPHRGMIGSLSTADGASRRVLFRVETAAEGSELWTSDGTVAGTVPAGPGRPGPASGASGELGRIGDRIFLAFDDGTTGLELYSMPAGALGIAAVDRHGAPCPVGVAPDCSVSGAPVTGGAPITIVMEGARVLAPAALLMGARADLPISSCRLLVDPWLVLALVTDVAGAARLPVQVPADPGLVGLQLHVQPAVADPAGVLGVVALGNAVAILVGH